VLLVAERAKMLVLGSFLLVFVLLLGKFARKTRKTRKHKQESTRNKQESTRNKQESTTTKSQKLE
jgi:hypothetical protein